MSREYKIFETRRFVTDLELLTRHRGRTLQAKLAEYVYPQLRREPHFGPNIKRLTQWDPPTWRYRVGDWRFFYLVDDGTRMVSMIAADHRKDAYRGRR